MTESPQRFERTVNEDEWKSTFWFDGPKFVTMWFNQFKKSYPSVVLVKTELRRYSKNQLAVIISFTDGADEAEFIMREGTDYGATEWSLGDKVKQVHAQLRAGNAQIIFDPQAETCTITSREELINGCEEIRKLKANDV